MSTGLVEYRGEIEAPMFGQTIAWVRPMRTSSALVLLAGLSALTFGCSNGNPEPEVTGTIPEQLESLQVALTDDNGQVQTAQGVLAVTGSDRQFQIAVAGGQNIVFDLHTPGASPIAALDGVDATVAFTEQGMGGRSVIVSDADGPLYVGALGDGMSLNAVDEIFGEGFVRWGKEVGTQTDGTFVWTYAPAVFATDNGEVELQPGNVTSIVVDGVEWRAVVSASYEVSTNPDADALPACSPESMLGFELLRVAEPIAATSIARAADAEIAYVGCTAPGGE